MITTTIDVERCMKAMKDLKIAGSPSGYVRLNAIEDAIKCIQNNGKNALIKEYIAVKNYASFGDQREDHEYGYGPRYGYIVFSIKRERGVKELNEDHVYYLECYRDFGTVKVIDPKSRKEKILTLYDVLMEYDFAKKSVLLFEKILTNTKVSVHSS